VPPRTTAVTASISASSATMAFRHGGEQDGHKTAAGRSSRRLAQATVIPLPIAAGVFGQHRPNDVGAVPEMAAEAGQVVYRPHRRNEGSRSRPAAIASA